MTIASPSRYLDYYAARQRMAEIIVEASRTPEVVNFACETIQGVGTGDYPNEAQALAAVCRDCIRYTGDASGEDFYKWPMLTLKQRAGDCNNKVLLFGALARAVGFPVRLAFVFEPGRSPQDTSGLGLFPVHVFACVDTYKGERESSQWVPVELVPVPDAINGYPSYTVPMGALPAHGSPIDYFDVDQVAA